MSKILFKLIFIINEIGNFSRNDNNLHFINLKTKLELLYRFYLKNSY